ncbi:hypothetical protein IL306_003981 [Fusarium sp. DS 682]|nr:hypothetical protein IL306_003981 [Fusarium sp. DS 682]
MGNATSFAAEAFTLLGIGVLIIFLRTYARIRQVGLRNFEADDYLMLLAIIPYTIETALAYTVGARFRGLTNSGMTEEERKALSPDSEEYTWRLNILTDVYLLAIPIPMLWGARIPKVKKYGLLVLFSGAVFVMVAGLLRCILLLKVGDCSSPDYFGQFADIIQNPDTGPEQAGSWAVRESFVAVVTANLPSTWGWMRQKLKPIFGSLLSSNVVSSKYKAGPEPGSIMLADGNGSNWKRSNGRSIRSNNGIGSTHDRNEHSVYIHGGGEASSDEIIPSMPGITKEVEFTVEEMDARKR